MLTTTLILTLLALFVLDKLSGKRTVEPIPYIIAAAGIFASCFVVVWVITKVLGG